MKAPGSSVHIQQLELTVPMIPFELHFHEPIEVDGPEKAFRKFLDLRVLYRFDIGSCAAKLSRMLAKSLRNQRAVGFTVTKESTVGILLLAIPGNNFLN